MKNLLNIITSISQPKTGLELYARYLLNSNCESATIDLFRVKKEYRTTTDEITVRHWLELINHDFADSADAEDSKTASNLPTSFSIQFRLLDRVLVLDIGHPVLGNPELKQVSERIERGLVYGEYDLIATIDKHFVRSQKSCRCQTVCACAA
jgi:hypothetical protein